MSGPILGFVVIGSDGNRLKWCGTIYPSPTGGTLEGILDAANKFDKDTAPHKAVGVVSVDAISDLERENAELRRQLAEAREKALRDVAAELKSIGFRDVDNFLRRFEESGT